MRRLGWCLWLDLVALAGCRSESRALPDAAVTSPVAAAPELGECTLATPLVPGVPGSPGHLIASERNPNGVSELAAHMRAMQADVERVRAALLKGELAPKRDAIPSLHDRHRKLRCAWPTDAADRNPAFDARARVYLDKVAAFDGSAAAPLAQRRRAFGEVVAACRTCHEVTCSGVLDAIDKLRLDGS